MITCPNCGKSVAEGVAHCGHCGHKMDIENKKTMLGMPAINAGDLQRSIAEAKDAAGSATQPLPTPSPATQPAAEEKPKLKLPTPGGGAPSSSTGGGFSLPKPSSAPAPQEEVAEAPDAKTLMLPQIRREEGEAKPQDPIKDAPLDSAPEQIQGVPSAGESSAAPTGPMEAASGGDDFSNFSEDAFAETIAGQTADDLAAQHAAQTAGRVGSETPVESTPTLEDAPPPSLMGGPMPGAPVPDGIPAGAPAGPGLDPYAPTPEMRVQPDHPMAQSAGGDMIPVATEGKSKKKLFIIIGIVLALLFGCCIIGNIVNMFVLPMINAAV